MNKGLRRIAGAIVLGLTLWIPHANSAQAAENEVHKGEQQLRQATEAIQDALTKRYEAACKALGARYVMGADGPRCLFVMEPDKVCDQLHGRWDGSKCVFEAMCPEAGGTP